MQLGWMASQVSLHLCSHLLINVQQNLNIWRLGQNKKEILILMGIKETKAKQLVDILELDPKLKLNMYIARETLRSKLTSHGQSS